MDKYDFKREIKELIFNSNKLAKSTKQKKFNSIFKKYDSLIMYRIDTYSDLSEKTNMLESAVNTLKTGLIFFDKGSIKLNSVTFFKKESDNRYVLKTKSGSEHALSGNFKFLECIFTNNYY